MGYHLHEEEPVAKALAEKILEQGIDHPDSLLLRDAFRRIEALNGRNRSQQRRINALIGGEPDPLLAECLERFRLALTAHFLDEHAETGGVIAAAIKWLVEDLGIRTED